jgi:predicted TIM-barrel fold metal-dependent hydrolase
MDYMSRGWQEYLRQPESLPGDLPPIAILPMFPYSRPDGDKLPVAVPEYGPAGSSYDLVKEQLLDAGVEAAVLNYDEGMRTPTTPNTHLARELARASNDWTIDRWLGRDERLHGLVLVPNQVTEHAVGEIARIGDHPQMVGILMSANGLGKPFGHPAYHPIYAAAAERGLPVVIHAGGDAVLETLTHPTAGGLPTSYAEYYIFNSMPLVTHFLSLVAQGVFEKFPDLKVLFSGGGITWLTAILWRFDGEYMPYRRETPWVSKLPSDYVRDNVRLCTYPLVGPAEPEGLIRLLQAFPGIEDVLVYGSGYPNWDTDFPETVAEQLPADWADKVFSENARDLFRWSVSTTTVAARSSAAVGEMDASSELASAE